MKPIIIVGTGLAGYSLAREFRKLDNTTPVFLITADDGGFYSKPMLSNAFAQGKEAAQLVTQTAAQMAAQLGATILTGTRVQRIDPVGKTVETSGGEFDYGKLVLAVGAQPVRLPMQGDAADRVMSVNHIDDYARFRDRIAQREGRVRITILGAGLIGCEFADDLAGTGHEVTLIDPNALPLSALAPAPLARGLLDALIARGVNLRLGTTATRVSSEGKALRVTLANGELLDTDLVLSAVGLRPDLRLAQEAGMKIGRGIAIDRYGRTSAPDIYALGDCAEYTTNEAGGTATLPYIAPLMIAARAIARTLAGDATPIELRPSPVIVKTPSFPMALLPPPAANRQGTWQETQYSEHIVCRYHDQAGTLVGFGVAPQDAVIRQSLIAELGKVKAVVVS
ncbi:MAG TPA: FAD-dependent oxidoreductase [Noviherbaspirillum sp.]